MQNLSWKADFLTLTRTRKNEIARMIQELKDEESLLNQMIDIYNMATNKVEKKPKEKNGRVKYMTSKLRTCVIDSLMKLDKFDINTVINLIKPHHKTTSIGSADRCARRYIAYMIENKMVQKMQDKTYITTRVNSLSSMLE